eukprot:jgi/Bigna1/131320/aug1.14_g6028
MRASSALVKRVTHRVSFSSPCVVNNVVTESERKRRRIPAKKLQVEAVYIPDRSAQGIRVQNCYPHIYHLSSTSSYSPSPRLTAQTKTSEFKYDRIWRGMSTARQNNDVLHEQGEDTKEGHFTRAITTSGSPRRRPPVLGDDILRTLFQDGRTSTRSMAMRLFKELILIKKATTFDFNAVFKYWIGPCRNMLNILDLMEREGVAPNAATYGILLARARFEGDKELESSSV